METKQILNCNSSDPTGFLNSSCTPTEAMVGEESFKWTSEEIVRLIQIFVRPMLTVTGTLGNALSLYIMRQSSLKNVSSCFYMAVLALADTGK